MNHLVNKLLGRHINAWQLAGFVLANLLGMAIVLIAVQFFSDIKPLMTGSDSFMRPGQLVITKRISGVRGGGSSFKQEEISELKAQPFTRDICQFTPAQYEVFASIGGGNMGMQFSTDMFFEAVPDDFLDVNTDKWEYDPDSYDVPIILPRISQPLQLRFCQQSGTAHRLRRHHRARKNRPPTARHSRHGAEDGTRGGLLAQAQHHPRAASVHGRHEQSTVA